MNRILRISIWTLAGILVTGAALALDRMDPVPLKNWKVPDISTAMKTWGDSPNTHFVNPGAWVFQTTVPCRQVDTRTANGPYGGPIFSAGQTRTYDLSSVTPTCGSSFPVHMTAVSINITVTQTAGTGFVTGFPTGGTLPPVSNITFIGAGVTLSNAAIIPTNGASSINIYASQQTHVIIDINGFFIGDLSDTGDRLAIVTSIGGQAAILGINNSNTDGSQAVGGFAGGTGVVFGVEGQVGGGSAFGSAGLHGIGNGHWAVRADGGGGSSEGVVAFGNLRGVNGSATADSSCGVCGFSFNGAANGSGVTAQHIGVAGFPALYVIGNSAVTGTKSFVEPNAADPSTQINYISIEAPEARTFITGRSRFVGGMATIDLPEHFRLVTDEEGLTVQVTPIGKMTSVAVLEVNLNQIQVQSTRDVEFFYTVTGIRSAFRNHQPVESNVMFRPDGGGGVKDIRPSLSPAAKAAMIKNGTLNPDGTWNRATAERLGWKLDEK